MARSGDAYIKLMRAADSVADRLNQRILETSLWWLITWRSKD